MFIIYHQVLMIWTQATVSFATMFKVRIYCFTEYMESQVIFLRFFFFLIQK